MSANDSFANYRGQLIVRASQRFLGSLVLLTFWRKHLERPAANPVKLFFFINKEFFCFFAVKQGHFTTNIFLYATNTQV